MSIIDKIKAARLTQIEAGGFTFTIRRPTALERLKLTGANSESLLKDFVVGWSGVKEIDLVPGGTDVSVPFSAELFSEWVVDQPQLWNPIVDGILEAMKAHDARLQDDEKKPDAG
jgi:hypothetical protein